MFPSFCAFQTIDSLQASPRVASMGGTGQWAPHARQVSEGQDLLRSFILALVTCAVGAQSPFCGVQLVFCDPSPSVPAFLKERRPHVVLWAWVGRPGL